MSRHNQRGILPQRNRPINNHPLVGSALRTYRADLPAYDPDEDCEGGSLVVAAGLPVGIKAVFQNWNGVPGLDMLYVYCPATGMHTHVTPFDVGLKPLDPDTAETEPFEWVELTGPEVEDYLNENWKYEHVRESDDGNTLLVPDYESRSTE